MIREEYVSTTTGRPRFEIDDIPEPCDAAGRLCRRTLSELHECTVERKLDKSTQEVDEVWERGVNITYSKKESYTDKPHYIITDTLGLREIIKSTITDASQATGTVTTRMLELSKSELTKILKKLSFEEDEAENGYQNDTQENNVTMDSETDGARYVLEFEFSSFLVTFRRYVQKTTSPICLLKKKTVAMPSKFVRLDSEIKCLGFCGTRKQSHVWFSCVFFF